MRPSRALGTFLRVWRKEWAGMTRAQLAIAVSGALSGRARVTEEIVRQWEEGQPPKTTAQLEALLAVMLRKGLTPFEIDQVRAAALAAVGDRHYPELYDDEPFASRPDNEVLAQTDWSLMWVTGRFTDARFIQWAADVEELRQALAEPCRDPSQQRRQDAALVYRLVCLAQHHLFSGRDRLDCACWGEVARLLVCCFGRGGLNPWLHPADAALRAHLTPRKRGSPAVWSYIAAAEAAMDRGRFESGARSLAFAYHKLPVADLPQAISRLGALLPRLEALSGGDAGQNLHYFLAGMCMDAGRLAEAESHISVCRSMASGHGATLWHWCDMLGGFDQARGAYGEALGRFEQGLSIAQENDLSSLIAESHRSLAECDRLRMKRARRPPAAPAGS